MTEHLQTSTILSDTKAANKSNLAKISELQNLDVNNLPKGVKNAVVFGAIGSLVLLFLLFASQIITGVFAFILTAAACIGVPLAWKYIKSRESYYLEKWRLAELEDLITLTRENSITSLKRKVIDDANSIKRAEQAFVEVSAIKNNVVKYYRDFDKEHRLYQQVQDMYDGVLQAFDLFKQNLELSIQAHEDFKKEVEVYEKFDKFSRSVNNFMSLINKDNDELKKQLTLEAFDSIDENFNRSMAQMDQCAMKMQSAQKGLS